LPGRARACDRYGDITPISIPGKFLVMVMIIISLAFVGFVEETFSPFPHTPLLFDCPRHFLASLFHLILLSDFYSLNSCCAVQGQA
jgi:hypothetical protein